MTEYEMKIYVIDCSLQRLVNAFLFVKGSVNKPENQQSNVFLLRTHFILLYGFKNNRLYSVIQYTNITLLFLKSQLKIQNALEKRYRDSIVAAALLVDRIQINSHRGAQTHVALSVGTLPKIKQRKIESCCCYYTLLASRYIRSACK